MKYLNECEYLLFSLLFNIMFLILSPIAILIMAYTAIEDFYYGRETRERFFHDGLHCPKCGGEVKLCPVVMSLGSVFFMCSKCQAGRYISKEYLDMDKVMAFTQLVEKQRPASSCGAEVDVIGLPTNA